MAAIANEYNVSIQVEKYDAPLGMDIEKLGHDFAPAFRDLIMSGLSLAANSLGGFLKKTNEKNLGFCLGEEGVLNDMTVSFVSLCFCSV